MPYKSTDCGLLSSCAHGLSAHLVVQALGQDVLQITPQGFGVPQNALILRLSHRLLHGTQLCILDVPSVGWRAQQEGLDCASPTPPGDASLSPKPSTPAFERQLW